MTRKRITPSTPAKGKQTEISSFTEKKQDHHPSPNTRKGVILHPPQLDDFESQEDSNGIPSDDSNSSSSTIKIANSQQDMEIELEALNQDMEGPPNTSSITDFPPLSSPLREKEQHCPPLWQIEKSKTLLKLLSLDPKRAALVISLSQVPLGQERLKPLTLICRRIPPVTLTQLPLLPRRQRP
jgi:hypothetical protein